LSSKAKLRWSSLKKVRLVSPGSKNQVWMLTPLPKSLYKRLPWHKTYPKSNCNNQKQINPCWKIAHTKTSKLLGGTGTSNTFGQDTMIILPLSQKTVKGSNKSERPLSWSTRQSTTKRNLQCKTSVPKTQVKPSYPVLVSRNRYACILV
jgi:hypothetical protein